MQGLHGDQVTAHAAAARKGVALLPLQLYSDLPREWPMARFRGTYFGDIPAEVYPAYIADLLHISEAFAAPLANLFAFVKNKDTNRVPLSLKSNQRSVRTPSSGSIAC